MLNINFFLLATILLWINFPAHATKLSLNNTDRLILISIYSDLEWLAINHYVKVSDNKWVSSITNKSYFIAKRGAKSPYIELIATLNALTNSNKKYSQEIYCRFPARIIFLEKHFTIKENIFSCPKYAQWIKEHKTDSVSIIYPSSYLNNPSSTFGHTFLRFDKKEKPIPLSFTVDYAAHIVNKPSFTSFIVDGVSGGYQGYYSYHPYYVKTWQYSDKENRKIWEYQLTLNAEEVERLLNHLWELRNYSIKYYFVRENCSYQILSLIKSAKPSLEFEPAFKYNTFPIDTIRYLSKEKMISSYSYLPTLQETILSKHNNLSASEKIIMDKILNQGLKIESIKNTLSSSKNSSQIYSFLHEVASFNLKNTTSTKISDDSSEILRYLLTKDINAETNIIVPKKIDLSHNVGRITVGITNRDEIHMNFSYRHSYHSFSDPLNHFTPGTETEVFHLQIEHDNDRLILDKLTLVKLTSIQPDELIFKPVSWQFDISSNRVHLDQDSFLINSTHIAVGKSYRIGKNIIYALPALSLNHHSDSSTFLQLGSGVFVGLLRQGEKSSLKIETRYKKITDVLSFTQYELSYTWQLSRELSMSYQYLKTSNQNLSQEENKLKLSYYY